MNQQYNYVYIDLDPENDEEDINNLALMGAAYELAKARNIGITSDRELLLVATDNEGKVVGAGFSSFDNENYDFDVVVSDQHEKQGIGTTLVRHLVSNRNNYTDAFPGSSMLVRVVSDQMHILLAKQGFVVTNRLADKTIIMGPSGECNELSRRAPTSDSNDNLSI